jgi:hypothetical protein
VLDLFYLPLNLENDQKLSTLPGLLLIPAPRYANRNRELDILAVLLTPNDPAFLPASELEKLIQKIAATYYRIPGPVTASLRAVTDQLNETFFKLNRKGRPGGQIISAALNIAVLRRDVLFLLQSGPAANLVLGRDHRLELSETINTAFGLGLGVTFNPSLRQRQVQPGDTLIIYTAPAANLSALFPHSGAQVSLDQLRLSLANQANGKVKIVIAQFRAGNGELHLLGEHVQLDEVGRDLLIPQNHLPGQPINDLDSLLPELSEVQELESTTKTSSPPASQTDHPKPAVKMAQMPKYQMNWQERFIALFLGQQTIERRRQEKIKRTISPTFLRKSSIAAVKPDPQADLQTTQPDQTGNQADFIKVEQPLPPIKEKTPAGEPAPVQLARSVSFRRRLASIWRGGRDAQNRIEQGGEKFFNQMLPASPSQPLPITPAMMLFIAVAVPLILVSIAATIYFREGPGKQHQVLVEQAQAQILQASSQDDPVLQRSALIQSLALLDKAENYILTDTSRALRTEAQQALDNADGIVRIIFEPLSDVIDGSANISHIQASATETYLLDGNSGSIIRLFSKEQKWVLDRNFNCGPGQLGLATIGPLIDMVIIPPGNPNKASVMGIDVAGNLLYCIPGSPPLSNVLPQPDMKWGKIGGLFLENGVLYVMDNMNNSVYIYQGEDNIYLTPPRQFFDNTVPYMPNVIDFEIKAEDLYLLHDDGMMTKCIFRTIDVIQTRCTDPMHYTDTRYRKTEQLLTFPSAKFIQLVTSQPPEPSVYILDSYTPSIYHFGLSLTLYEQIQMQVYTNFSKPQRQVSAFAVSPGKRVWMAFGNQIFYGQLP